MNEMVSGVRADLGVKLFGDDFDVLVEKAQEIEAVLRSIPGSADVSTEQITGQPVLQIKVDQEQIARYGVSAESGAGPGRSRSAASRWAKSSKANCAFRWWSGLPEECRESPEAIGAMLIATPSGERIPLSRLAKRARWSKARRRSRASGTSGGSRSRPTSAAATWAALWPRRGKEIAAQVALPSGRYRIEYGGQFEHLERARTRLLIVVPLALALIFALLYFTYHNLIDALRVFTGIPFAWVGGIFALWLRDMPFSISAGVGFIALSGVAVLDDMILVSYVRQLRERGLPLDEAVTQAAITRLRPVLMTTLVASLGFVPMALSTAWGPKCSGRWPRSSSAA